MRFVVLVHDDHVAWDFHTEGCNLLREHGEVEFLCLPTGLLQLGYFSNNQHPDANGFLPDGTAVS